MTVPTLRIQRHYDQVKMPARAHASDVGIDLTAYAMIPKRDRVFFFDTGISVQMDEGWYVEIMPRSSICKTDFILANSVGVIDPDYRGIVYVPMRYVGEGDGQAAAEALVGQRIAQLLVRKLEACQIVEAEKLNETVRGAAGFGSSGQ